ESSALQNVRDETAQIAVAERNGGSADACEPVHIITVVGCEPHEVGSRARVEIIDERTDGHRTAARVGENNLRATRRTIHDVSEPDERVMLRSIRLMITQVTATRHVLVLHVALPSQA